MDQEVKKIIELYETGLSCREVGKKVGLSTHQVSRRLRKHGKTRTQAESAKISVRNGTHWSVVEKRAKAREMSLSQIATVAARVEQFYRTNSEPKNFYYLQEQLDVSKHDLSRALTHLSHKDVLEYVPTYRHWRVKIHKPSILNEWLSRAWTTTTINSDSGSCNRYYRGFQH